MIFQRKDKNSPYVAKHNGTLYLTGKKDIGDAIDYVLQKASQEASVVTKVAIDRS